MDNRKIQHILRKIIKEELQRLSELDVSDPELSKKIEEYARISDEMDRLSSQLSALKKKFAPLDSELTTLIESVDDIGDKSLRTKNLLITVKRKGYERTDYKYKESFEWLFERVNGKMKELVEEAKEASKTVTKISSTIAVQKIENVLREENLFTRLINRLKKFISDKVKKMFAKSKSLELDMNKLEKLANS